MVNNVKPGEREASRASERVIRKNVQSGIQFSNDTRKMVLELRVMFDSLQGNVMNMHSDLVELRRQLAILQQQSCAKGTVNYSEANSVNNKQ